MGPTDKRQHVMLTQRTERNVANNHHLVVTNLKLLEQVIGWVLAIAPHSPA